MEANIKGIARALKKIEGDSESSVGFYLLSDGSGHITWDGEVISEFHNIDEIAQALGFAALQVDTSEVPEDER